MKPVTFLFWVLRNLSTAMAAVAGISVFLLALLIALDVLARRLLGVSLQGTDEIGGYVLAAVASLGFSYVLFERGFMRIDLVIRKLPTALADLLNVIAYVSLAVIAVFFALRALATYRDTLLFDSHANTPLQTPMWIPQGIWVVGIAFFAACSTLFATRALVLLFIDRQALDAEFGIVKFDEDVADIVEVTTKASKNIPKDTNT